MLRIDAEFEPGAAGRVGLVLRAGGEAGGESAGLAGAGARTVLAYDCRTA